MILSRFCWLYWLAPGFWRVRGGVQGSLAGTLDPTKISDLVKTLES